MHLCCLLCYLSLRLSRMLGSYLTLATSWTVLLSSLDIRKIIDILPVMNRQSAKFLPGELYTQKENIKNRINENCVHGKWSQKTCSPSQARPRHRDHMRCAYLFISPFFMIFEVNSSQPAIAVSGAGYAPKTDRMAFPPRSRVGN